MRFLNRGILLDIIIVFFVLLKDYITFVSGISLLSIIIFLYGIFSLISYLFVPETVDGESRSSYLLFGSIYFIFGLLSFSFAKVLDSYETIILLTLTIIHGISRMLYKNNKGLWYKIICIVWGVILIIYALYYCGYIIKEPVYLLSTFNYSVIFLIVDLILLVLFYCLPRNDLENKNIKIGYSSYEDQVIYKKGYSSHEVEVIDLDRLFNRKKGENENEEM